MYTGINRASPAYGGVVSGDRITFPPILFKGVNMTKPFKDPIRPKKKEHGKYPWDFKAPSYDNRSSCSINVGDDYGTGFNQPIGKFKAKEWNQGPIPMGNKAFDPKPVIEHEKEG